MNIFVLDLDPYNAAIAHCDKHVVKMILESAQLLSTANHELGRPSTSLYKPTHINHPCAKWTRESVCNYMWLYELYRYLCEEYTHRYSKTHKSAQLDSLLLTPPPSIPQTDLTPFAQAMPNEYKNPNTVIAYRNYYSKAKTSLLTYTNRDKPYWLKFYL